MGFYTSMFEEADKVILEAERKLCALNEEYSKLKWWQLIKLIKLSGMINDAANQVYRLKCLRSNLWR